MLRSLVLTLCVQSLLQVGPPLVLARPDFGLALPISNSGKVSAAATNAEEVVLAVDDNTEYTADTSYPSLQPLANLLADVADLTVQLGGGLVPLVTALVSDVSGDVAAAFGPVQAKIAEIKTALSGTLPATLASITALVGHYVPDQLTDGFDRIGAGIGTLESRLGTLKTAIDAAVSAAGTAADVTDALVRQKVKPTLIYQVVFAINQLRSYVPEVKYTVDSTLENINLADDYLLIVYEAYQQSSVAGAAMVGRIEAVTVAIASTVQTELDGYAGEFQTLQEDVAALPVVPMVSDYTAVTTALAGYSALFARLDPTLYPAMEQHLQALLDTMSVALSGSTTPGELSSDLLDSLILTLIENGKFAQFCFYKYYGLVLAFLTSLADRAALCFDKEELRLTFLKQSLPLITALLPADFDDILTQLTVCDTLSAPADISECLTTLSGFYGSLATELGHKVQYVFDLIQTETEASAQRFLICIELAKLNLVEISEPTLTDEIRQCALGGPTADD